jgi:hypothetical protein
LKAVLLSSRHRVASQSTWIITNADVISDQMVVKE